MNILHISALPIWPLGGKGGMPSLAETLSGHVRGGHNITVILPEYDLFSSDEQRIHIPSDAGYEVILASCPWLAGLKAVRRGVVRLTGSSELPFAVRWVLNMTTWLLLTVSLVWAALGVRYRLKRRFDLVYAHNQYAAIAGWLLRLILKVPNVTRLYGTFLADLMKRPLVWLRYPVAAGGYLVPHSLLICGNDGTRGDEVARRLHINLDRFRFWQNGVALPDKPPDKSREWLMSRFPDSRLRPASKWILSCSRLSYWKRIDRMLRAVRECRRAGCDCQLLVAGDGPQRDSLCALAEELGIVDDVVWLGAIPHDDIWVIMNVADVFMITNDVTNRCNPLYEAICAGLPVVSVRDSSTKDLLEHGVNALLADKENEEQLSSCLREACTDAALAERLGGAQTEVAAKFWTWRERMEAELVVLESLVQID